MRWKDKSARNLVTLPGALRTVRRFLWLPKSLEGETRWLERVDIEQRFEQQKTFNAFAGDFLYYCGWADKRWK